MISLEATPRPVTTNVVYKEKCIRKWLCLCFRRQRGSPKCIKKRFIVGDESNVFQRQINQDKKISNKGSEFTTCHIEAGFSAVVWQAQTSPWCHSRNESWVVTRRCHLDNKAVLQKHGQKWWLILQSTLTCLWLERCDERWPATFLQTDANTQQPAFQNKHPVNKR